MSDLTEFIRLKIAIFTSFFAMSGFLLFNPLSLDIVFVALAAFFACAGAASYNNITDVEEDKINRKMANPFAYSPKGKIITTISILLGSLFSSMFSFFSLVSYLAVISVLLIYSVVRIKRYTLIKNIYTAFGNSLVFFIGVGKFIDTSFPYYMFISAFVFIGSILSDLRDVKGDKIANIRTLPVVFGCGFTKKLVYALSIVFSILLINSGIQELLILLPFALLIVPLVSKDKIKIAHMSIGIPFIFLTLWLAIK